MGETVACPACGSPLPVGGSLCAACGRLAPRLGATSPEQQAAQHPPMNPPNPAVARPPAVRPPRLGRGRRRARSWLTTTIVLVTFLAAVVGVVVLVVRS